MDIRFLLDGLDGKQDKYRKKAINPDGLFISAIDEYRVYEFIRT